MNQYKFAKLYDQKGDLSKRWFVGYSYRHPETQKFSLFKIWLSSALKTKTARIKKANQIIQDTNNKLLNGYNPFQNENISFTNIIDAVNKILAYKSAYTKKRTVQTYRCFTKSFTDWLEMSNYTRFTIEAFNFQYAREYADYLVTDKKVSNRTFNNYIEFMRTIFNDLVNREYILRNPFRKIELLPEGERTVFAYNDYELQLLRDHFPKNAPQVWLVCQLVYYCAIRPAEIVKLRIKYIDIKNRKIIIPAEISKTNRFNVVNVPQPLIEDLKKLDLHGMDPDSYLFSRNLVPGNFLIAPTRLAEAFKKEADKIGLKRKLYELKHTGAGKAIEAGANIRDVQLHLRHTDINTTEIYLRAFKSSTSREFIMNFPEL